MNSGSEWPSGTGRRRLSEFRLLEDGQVEPTPTTIWFAVDKDGRFYIATRDSRSDWVRNAEKKPLVDITIRNVTRKMRLVPLKSDSEKNHVGELYRKKYLLARVGGLFGGSQSPHSDAFELLLNRGFHRILAGFRLCLLAGAGNQPDSQIQARHFISTSFHSGNDVKKPGLASPFPAHSKP